MSDDATVADIRHRFNLLPDSLLKFCDVMGMDIDRDAPKHFTFHQRFETERVRDGNGFYVREKDANGIHRWKTIRRAYIEVWLHVGAIGVNLNANHHLGDDPSTMDAAKRCAFAFAEKYGFEPRYEPTGAEKTRSLPKAKVLAFPRGAE